MPSTAAEVDKVEPVLLPLVRPVFALHGMLGVDEDHKPTFVEINELLDRLRVTRESERWLWIHLFGVITSTRALERQRTMDALTESK